VAVIAATKNKEKARRVIDFLLASKGQETLARYGFGKP
jgi:ABC-type Fe3+ transport system substrate-binding protein